METIEYDAKPTRPSTTTRTTTPAPPQNYQNYGPVRQNNYQQNMIPSQREISETDLFLLSAIEKLTYRVDYMEKRLKKTEQLLYYIMEGNGEEIEQKPGTSVPYSLIFLFYFNFYLFSMPWKLHSSRRHMLFHRNRSWSQLEVCCCDV